MSNQNLRGAINALDYTKLLEQHAALLAQQRKRLGVCRREKSSCVESTTYKPLRVAKCLYVIDSTLVDIFILTDS
jgi:hypothetical protein